MEELDRKQKIKGLNYWQEYKQERERLIELAVQLSRSKFIVKRLLTIYTLYTIRWKVKYFMKDVKV